VEPSEAQVDELLKALNLPLVQFKFISFWDLASALATRVYAEHSNSSSDMFPMHSPNTVRVALSLSMMRSNRTSRALSCRVRVCASHLLACLRR
jgi:hypothetical protein